MPLRVSARMAITAQQFCSIDTAMNLLVSDGISKTAVWKNQDVLTKGTSQIRERSRYWHAGFEHGLKASFNHHSKKETQICASRRSPR
jgi:hypothetical protein